MSWDLETGRFQTPGHPLPSPPLQEPRRPAKASPAWVTSGDRAHVLEVGVYWNNRSHLRHGHRKYMFQGWSRWGSVRDEHNPLLGIRSLASMMSPQRHASHSLSSEGHAGYTAVTVQGQWEHMMRKCLPQICRHTFHETLRAGYLLP